MVPTFGKIGLLFIPKSGHTAGDCHVMVFVRTSDLSYQIWEALQFHY